MLTRVGGVCLQRAYYYCSSCHTGQLPFDRESGLGRGQLSEAVASAVSLLAVHDSFEEASRAYEALMGVRIDDNVIASVTELAGQTVVEREDQSIAACREDRQPPASETTTDRLYVSMDGTTAPTLDGWREVKCGAVYWDDPIEGHQAQYVGRIEGCEFSGQRLWYLACRHGLRQAKEVIVIGDGAEWVWNQSRLHFGRATEILDWFHASEHVWACANELYGQGSKKAKRWASRMLKTMRYQGGKGMLKGLRRSRRSRTTGHDALDSLIGYVCTHQERMDYPAYRRRGLDIGSGPIEATCKRLVNRRFKGAGMHWRPENINAVVTLRAAWLNHQWDPLWQAHPLAA